jgi:hypothetical protein
MKPLKKDALGTPKVVRRQKRKISIPLRPKGGK